MRKILNSRIFRILICLVLICCFLVNSSPIKAEAFIAELISTAPVWVPVATAAAAIVIALGVMASDDRTSFNTVVNDVVTYLETSTTYVVNGMVAVWGVFGADQITRSYVLKDMIQDVWCWLFDSGVVFSLPSSVSAGTSFLLGGRSYTATSSVVPLIVRAKIGYNIYYVHFFIGGSDPTLKVAQNGVDMITYVTDVTGVDTYYAAILHSPPSEEDINQAFDFSKTNYSNVTAFGSALIAHFGGGSGSCFFAPNYADGLILGQIQAPPESKQLEDTEVYTDYITKIEFCPDGRPDYGEDKKEHLPIGLPSTDLDDLLLSQTQEQGQSGDTNLEFDFETSTDPDPGTGEPGTGTDTDSGSSGSSSWTPPSDMGKFTLDLKDYFPFCIPFDLYAFFTCLNAEPVAPVIEWIIPLPGGMTYPFEIDLSAFDSVAQILRRMQLLLFCVGLAFKTRDLIKG